MLQSGRTGTRYILNSDTIQTIVYALVTRRINLSGLVFFFFPSFFLSSIDPPLLSAAEMTKIALVSALYVTVTSLLAIISFGAIPLRLSEMFNYLALYNKRYIISVTMGVLIVNFMSPTWVLDVPIGTTATLLVLLLCRFLTKRIKNDIAKIVVTALVFAVSMFTVAAQLVILFDLPFFYTWLTTALGELLSMTIGGIIIYFLSKKIDLTR